MFQDLMSYLRGDYVYRTKLDSDLSYKMTKRSRIKKYCYRMYSIVKEKKSKPIYLSFILIRSKRYSFSSYWKIFISDQDTAVDVTREIGITLEYELYNDNILKESSFGVSIPEDICRRLTDAFRKVFKEPVEFYYKYFNATLEN